MASFFEGTKNNGAMTFLSKSRDVIGHVTSRIPIPHFLFVLHCDQAPISSPFRDIGPKDNWVTTLTFLVISLTKK